MKLSKRSPPLWAALILSFYIFITYYSSNLFEGLNFTIPVYIPEMGENYQQAFMIDFSRIFEILTLGFVFSCLYYVLIHKVTAQLQKDFNPSSRDNPYEGSQLQKRVKKVEFFTVYLIVLIICGHCFHLLFDYASQLYRGPSEVYPPTELMAFLYVMDEHIGHALIHVAYFLMMALIVYLEIVGQPKEKCRRIDIIAIVIIGFGVGMLHGWGACMGEMGFVMLVLNGISLVVQIAYIIVKKLNLKKYPTLDAHMIGNIFAIVIIIIYASFDNVLPYFPLIS